MSIKVNILIDGNDQGDILCSGVHETTLNGVEVSERVIGPRGKIAGLSEYDVNLVIEAALSDKFFDITSKELSLRVWDYSVSDIMNEVVTAEDVGYAAEFLE